MLPLSLIHIYDNQNFRLVEGGRLGEVWGYKMNGFYTVYNPEIGTGDLKDVYKRQVLNWY